MQMNTHDPLIVKRCNEQTNLGSLTLAQVRGLHTREEISKVVCSCGWESDWHPTEQLAREEYGKHKFMSVKFISDLPRAYEC